MLPGLPDWEMWLRQLSVGDCYIIPEPLSCIRNHSGQVTKKVINSFVNYFEEYELCKTIKEHDEYSLDISEIDMEKVTKMRAANCAKAMFKVMLKLHNKENRAVFVKAFKIASSEKVIASTFFAFVGKSLKLSGKIKVANHKQAKQLQPTNNQN
ncbi:MAG: hypothetical protein ABJA79_02770 [Parafilimonas sp.]